VPRYVESEPEKCENAPISAVRVDLASEDTGMESGDDTMPWRAQEPRQELIVCNAVSGLEMVRRSDENQVQLVDNPEYDEVSPLLCVPLATIDPLRSGDGGSRYYSYEGECSLQTGKPSVSGNVQVSGFPN
jgi:hypothetical protein